MFLITALQALWGSSIPLSKILLTMTPPIFLAGLRMIIAGIVLLSYNYWFKNDQFVFTKKHISYYLQLIFFGVYIKYILRNWGLMHLSTAKMSFMLNASPFCTALFSFFAFEEILSQRQWAGLCIGFLGLIPILLIHSSSEHALGQFAFFSWPELAIIGEILSHSYGLIVARKMICTIGYSPAMANGIRMFGGGILALTTSFLCETPSSTAQTSSFFMLLALSVLISNVICHSLHFHLLNHYSPTFLSFSDFLSPLFVALYGWLFMNEIITWHYYLSASIIFVGLYLFYGSEKKES
ncbi:MAG TPA: EamA family transporter [Candidatus Bathyarchaeia archaeon]|nr:EamA family transporter [Candidatus Bathyarchaeia archaeon]